MTEKEKQAISVLNRLLIKENVTEEEYFTLLEFVMAPKTQTKYVPIYPTDANTQPDFPQPKFLIDPPTQKNVTPLREQTNEKVQV